MGGEHRHPRRDTYLRALEAETDYPLHSFVVFLLPTQRRRVPLSLGCSPHHRGMSRSNVRELWSGRAPNRAQVFSRVGITGIIRLITRELLSSLFLFGRSLIGAISFACSGVRAADGFPNLGVRVPGQLNFQEALNGCLYRHYQVDVRGTRRFNKR